MIFSNFCFLQLLFFPDGSSLFRFNIFNLLLLDFIRAWDFPEVYPYLLS